MTIHSQQTTAVTTRGAEPTPEAIRAREQRDARERERRLRRLRGRRVRRVLLLSLPILAVAAWFLRPQRVAIGAEACWAWPGTTVAEAISKAGIEPPDGDLLDMTGAVMGPGQGEPAAVLSGSTLVARDARASEFDELTFEPGEDYVEDAVETVELQAVAQDREPWKPSWEPLYFASPLTIEGMTRRRRGSISGATATEAAQAGIAERTGSTPPLPKVLALTFDDGPAGESTRDILDILDEHGAKGTFFVLGDNVPQQKDLVRETVERGHEVGNHSYGHPNLKLRSVSYAIENIAKAEAIISEAAGTKCRWFRPPYGNTTTAQRKAILEAGYNIALWSCDTNDWRGPSSDTLYRRIVGGVRPGATILMHDTSGSRITRALERAVPEIKRMGYRMVTLSELEKVVAGDDAGMLLTVGDETYEARPPEEPVRVLFDGRELTELHPMLAVRGKILLPACEVLEALGVGYTWNETDQTVRVRSEEGSFILRMDSTRLSRGRVELRVGVPPMLYHSAPLVSADLLARTTGMILDTSDAPRELRFRSVASAATATTPEAE